jgi:peptidoglycan/LPS O-acetylase OafA/YrhL
VTSGSLIDLDARLDRRPRRGPEDRPTTEAPAHRTAWARARELAERTPGARNRYVDFLRAASILVVVIGHWLMAAPAMGAGAFSLGDMLHVAPWTQWLTWAFQVMPLFFVVGGYANAASWDATRRSGTGYASWIASRLQRLVLPVVPLLLLWAALAALAHRLGASAEMIRVGSQVAFMPTWFLAVYVMVVVVAPGTYWAWRRFGMASFWFLALGAVLVDAVAFSTDRPGLRWANYGFVWLAVHHLGYLWRDGKMRQPARALPWAAGGLGVLLVLVHGASYPVSMISVPGEAVSNSRPPTLALLALGAFHAGLVLALEAPARRALAGIRLWTATVLVNGSIMTLYLWHATVMVLAVGVAYWLGGVGLRAVPGSAGWWATRPVWLAVLFAALAAFVATFGRFERPARTGARLPAWRSVAGAAAVCGGLAVLALQGIGSPGALGIRAGIVLLVLAGAASVGWRRGLAAQVT